MRRLSAALFVLATAAWAQKLDPAKWTLELVQPEARPGGYAVAKLTAKIETPWHLYSPTTPKGGPIVTKIGLADSPVVDRVEVYRPKPERKPDPNFGIDTETYEHDTAFLLKIYLKADAAVGPAELTAQMRYQMCTDKQCLPPVRRTAAATLQVKAGAADAAFTAPEGYGLVPAAEAAAAPKPAEAPKKLQESGLGGFALVAFGLGLAALFTPCVFPMIPFTVTYFLNRQSGSRADSILQAGVFAGGIVLLFTSLGLLATVLLGPFGAVQLGSNPWVNGFIAVIFFAFACSLLGTFEITLPSSVLTKMDQESQSRGGILGSLLMGLTFSLTSFACVGPFVGSLLAASVQGDKLQPTIGMMAFSSGLATPFFLLALFPSVLSKMPRSGVWMMRVKVVLGFVLLALTLKYLSNVDQVLQWNLLTRERFLAAWVVLFALPGLYLMGFLRMEGVKADQPLGVGRALTATAFLAFALSLLPGMFGGRLGELEGYVPMPSANSIAAGGGGGEKLAWMTNQYREALVRAKAENKLLLINFTGYACTNCHWMRQNMFPRPEIMAELKNFILVELYTDGTDKASEENQALQNTKFSTIAIPYYALVDGDERVIASFPGLTRNAEEFIAFLKSGVGLRASL